MFFFLESVVFSLHLRILKLILKCFISRYKRHKCFYNSSKYTLKITHSKHFWVLKDRKKDFSINWEVLARTKNKFNLKHSCTFCDIEKHEISKLNLNLALNKRNELFSSCKHFSSFYFK